MEYAFDGPIVECSHHEAKQSSTASREEANKRMESSAKLTAKKISPTISEVQRSFVKSKVEPRSGDASLPSSSIASLVKVSYTGRHLATEDKTERPLYSTSITVREPQGPLYGAENMVGDLTNSNHFDKLSAEIQYMIIKECIPERDSSRQFSVSLDPKKQILLEEKQKTQHTSILFVSRTFRTIYLNHLPIILPSFDKKSPICIHQGTTVTLNMRQLDLHNTKMWRRVRIPACFSEIRHLAVPVVLGTHNIGFTIKMIFACSNLRSLIATRTHTIEKERFIKLDHMVGRDLRNQFAFLLNRDLIYLADFLNLQLLLTGYGSKELAYYMTFDSSEGKNLNVVQNTIGNSERLQINKINLTRICLFEIESFIDKYCCESPHLAKLPEQLRCGIDPDLVRGVLCRSFTRRIDRYFNPSTNIKDTKQNKWILEVIRKAFERHKRSNPDDGDSIKALMSNTSQVIES